MNYFLIPGNPPATHFYDLWTNEISHTQDGSRGYVSHYPDMSPTVDSHEAMTKVLDAHLEQLEKFSQMVKEPVTIMGHSLGGYFALKLLEKVPEQVARIILIHPFIREPSLLGKSILNLVGSLHNFDKLQKAIVSSRKGLELFNSDLPFVTNEEIIRSFHLARHESRTIGVDRSPISIRAELTHKVVVFFTKGDDWCRPNLILDMKKQVKVFECTEPHGFITRKSHRTTLFKKIFTLEV